MKRLFIWRGGGGWGDIGEVRSLVSWLVDETCYRLRGACSFVFLFCFGSPSGGVLLSLE